MNRNISPHSPKRGSGFSRTIRKFFVSGFVIFSFAAYALHEHLRNPLAADTPIAGPATTQVLKRPTTVPTAAPREPTRSPIVARQATAVPTFPLSSAPTDTLPTQVPPTDVLPTQAPPTDIPPTDIPPTDPPVAQGQYRDGQYTGSEVDVFYGYVQVKAVVQNGKIADVQFLEFPQDRRTSQRINAVAVPYLQQEAVQAQTANVDVITGATLTSEGFIQSLRDALATAQH